MSTGSLASQPPSKKRRIFTTLPTVTPGPSNWVSEYNLEGKVVKSQNEVGDGASSRVYTGVFNGDTVAVKQLKCYSPRLSSALINSYEWLFHLEHTNIVKVYGICPKAGQVVMEYCEKIVNSFTIHTLHDLQVHLGSEMPIELRLLALSDVAEGLEYLHNQGLVHGDIKPQNVLVSGLTDEEYIFKITDYCGITINSQISSRSSSLKQFMTPGYLAPELICDNGSRRQSTKPSDIYSFGILSFEVYFCCEAWPLVSMQLLDAVRRGHRPTIPSDAPNSVVNVIKECWLHDCTSRPSASAVSRLMQELLSLATNTDDVMPSTSDHTDSIETGGVSSDHMHCSTNTNSLVANGTVIDSNDKGDDTISSHPSSSRTSSVAELHVTCGNATSSTLLSQNIYPKLSTGITTQSHEPLSNVLAMRSGGTIQSDCIDELSESTPVRAEQLMTHVNTNNTSKLSDVTDSTFILSTQYTSQPDNNTSSTDVLTQTDSAFVPQDSSSDDFLSTNICVSSQSASSTIDLDFTGSLEKAKSMLKIKELKQFQISCIAAIQQGKDVVLVQPTGSGKSVCFVIPALLNPGKVCLVIEPVVAVITNQVDSLQKKGIDAVALGRAAGNSKSSNFRRVFQGQGNTPEIAFCTPEYLFGTPATGSFSGTSGQYSVLLSNKENFALIAIDEAHKIFDRIPSYRPAFDEMVRLKDLPCPIVAMSATLTSSQIKILQQNYLHHECIVLTKGVHRDNLQLSIKRYKRCKQQSFSGDEEDDDVETDSSCHSVNTMSMWGAAVSNIQKLLEGHSTVVYLDFVRDVDEVTDILRQDGCKVGKYTGQMSVGDRQQADRKFLAGDLAVLIATESFELGVDNPNISQVIRIGCPRNLGVLLQEVGRAGRKEQSSANGMLYVNEYIDDKRLGLWLKSLLDSEIATGADSEMATGVDSRLQAIKTEMLLMYTQSWRFIYSIYHGECLSRALSYFYAGANDNDPPSCFIANSPLCAVCVNSEALSQVSIDIKEHMILLLRTTNELCLAGVQGVTKTLLTAVLLGINEQYVRSFEVLHEILSDKESCWGCGTSILGNRMSQLQWHKIIYVAVHLGFLDLLFNFRPFDSHYEVHRRYVVSSLGNEFYSNPKAIMSPDPRSTIVDVVLGVVQKSPYIKSSQNRGVQLKPRIIAAVGNTGNWIDGTIEKLKYLGFGDNGGNDVCMYFSDCFSLNTATSDPHYLLNCIQFSRTQSVTNEVSITLDGSEVSVMMNRSYCSGVKVCGGDDCTYTVTTKQKVNRCKEHSKMALIPTGACSCHLAYVYPKNMNEDGRRWFVALSCEKNQNVHNHSPPSEWKILPHVLQDITQAVCRNIHVTPKDIQNGRGLDYQPMEASFAAANISRIRSVVKKAKSCIDKADNERVNPFKIIASFPAIKERIDGSSTSHCNTENINKLVGMYQLDDDNAYSFGRDKQYAFFQSPFQAEQWSTAEALFIDIDYTGCHHFPYLLNIVCQNRFTLKYMACGRALLNHQDGISIGKALSVLTHNVKRQHKDYDINRMHKEILLDFDDAESRAFIDTFGEPISNLLRGCSVHFIRSAMRVAKLVNSSTISPGYHIFMSIVKRIPDEPSKDVVQDAFEVLCGAKSFETLSRYLPPNLSSMTADQVDTHNWKSVETWSEWWRRPHVLKKLSKAYSAITNDEWDDLPGTTNPVESINRQSIPENVKSVSLKPLVEHIYLEDKRHAVLQLASQANITISYEATKPRKRSRRPPKPPEKRSSLMTIPNGKRAIGTRLSVEFFDDDTQSTTTWYQGTIIAYKPRQGHIVSFDGCGPEENELIKSLKKAVEKGEIRLL